MTEIEILEKILYQLKLSAWIVSLALGMIIGLLFAK